MQRKLPKYFSLARRAFVYTVTTNSSSNSCSSSRSRIGQYNKYNNNNYNYKFFSSLRNHQQQQQQQQQLQHEESSNENEQSDQYSGIFTTSDVSKNHENHEIVTRDVLHKNITRWARQERWHLLEALPTRERDLMDEDLFRHLIYALGVRGNRWSRATRVWYSMLHWMRQHGEKPSLETINIMINSTVLDTYTPLQKKMVSMKKLLEMMSAAEYAEKTSNNESFLTVMMYSLAKDIVDRSSASMSKAKTVPSTLSTKESQSRQEQQHYKEEREAAEVSRDTHARLSNEIMSLLTTLAPLTNDADEAKPRPRRRERTLQQYAQILRSCVELLLHLKSSAYDVQNEEVHTEWKTQLRFYFEQLIASGATVRPHLLSEIIKSFPFNNWNITASSDTCDKMLDLISVAMDANLEFDEVVLGTLTSAFIDHSDARAFKMIEIFTNDDTESVDFSSIEPVKQLIDKYPQCRMLDTMPASVLLNMLNRFMQNYPGDWESYEQSATKLAQKMTLVASPHTKIRNYSIILDMYAKLPADAYAKRDIWARVQEVLDDMKENKIIPNHMCSSSFLYVAGRSSNKNGDRVFEALNILLDHGVYIHMDIILSLLDNLVNLADQRVFHVYKMLRGDSLSGIAEESKVEPIPVIERMMKLNVAPFVLYQNPSVYSVMIKACNKFALVTGDIQQYVTLATDLFNEAHEKNMLHESAVSSMLDMLGMRAKWATNKDEREEIKHHAMLLMQVIREKYSLQKNVAHVNALLNVVCKCNEFELAMKLFEALDEDMMNPGAFNIILNAFIRQNTPLQQIQEFYHKYERYSTDMTFVRLFRMIDSAEDGVAFNWICDQTKKHMGTLAPSQILFESVIKAKVALGESLSEVQSFADRHIAKSLGHDMASVDDADMAAEVSVVSLEKDLIVYTHLLKCCVNTKEHAAGLLLFEQGKNLPVSRRYQGKNNQYQWYLNLLYRYALQICTDSCDLANGRRIFEELKERGMADFMAYFGLVDMQIKINENVDNFPVPLSEITEALEKARSLTTPRFRGKMRILEHLYESFLTSKEQAHPEDESF